MQPALGRLAVGLQPSFVLFVILVVLAREARVAAAEEAAPGLFRTRGYQDGKSGFTPRAILGSGTESLVPLG